MPEERTVRLASNQERLAADLCVPPETHGVVLFAHGSGSGRRSPRNRRVAEALQLAGFATLLVDLLTEREAAEDERTAAYRFRIPLLARRLSHAVAWVGAQPEFDGLGIGLYGSSTGGAAALLAAADGPDRLRALVLRGARSDLAEEAAAEVRAPTLFLVGELDPVIREANRATAARLKVPYELVVVPSAGHLFEEPGGLEAVAAHAVRWCTVHLHRTVDPPASAPPTPRDERRRTRPT